MMTLKKIYNKSKLLFTETDLLINEIKMVAKILESVKKCLILVVTRLRQNTMIIQVNNSLEK